MFCAASCLSRKPQFAHQSAAAPRGVVQLFHHICWKTSIKHLLYAFDEASSRTSSLIVQLFAKRELFHQKTRCRVPYAASLPDRTRVSESRYSARVKARVTQRLPCPLIVWRDCWTAASCCASVPLANLSG
ncbi:hypothetical protein KCP76_02470 [Salmonella enterica subsp. enterica serovar Weltevreden]|nr:hypothetical protein KCP76_02470 [Salmonella enterica subsp. enterica serovar Weltevreden]